MSMLRQESVSERIGCHLQALFYSLKLIRMNVLLLVCVVVLLHVGQGQDLLRNMDQHWPILSGTLIWTGSIWLWARFILDFRYRFQPVPDHYLQPYRRWLPRILSVIAFGGVAWACSKVNKTEYTYLWLVVEGLTFFLFVTYRRRLSRQLALWVYGPRARISWLWMEEVGETVQPIAKLGSFLKGVQSLLLALNLTLMLLMIIVGAVWPFEIGKHLNSFILIMLWTVTVLPLGSLLTYFSQRNGLPVITGILVLSLASSAILDSHPVRLQSSDLQDSRLTLHEAIENWRQEHCELIENRQVCRPFVMVAAMGGGIRAGYWSGLALSKLYAQEPEGFDQSVFGLSSASGGSMGTAVFKAAHASQVSAEKIDKVVTSALSEDYLGPVISALLFRDFWQGIIPIPMQIKDRGVFFEQSLEQALTDAYQQHNIRSPAVGLSQSLLDIAAQAKASNQPAWPVLFLNSAWSNAGRRIVSSNVSAQLTNTSYLAYADAYQEFQHPVALSSAAHNSARFPYISPAGSWVDKQGKKHRLQDGGIYENFGAATAFEILLEAQGIIGEGFDPVVFAIYSDLKLKTNMAISAPPAGNFLAQAMNPITTLLNAKTGRGQDTLNTIYQYVRSFNPENKSFYFVSMCRQDQTLEPPLSWALSKAAQEQIQSYLTSDSDNPNEGFRLCVKNNRQALQQLGERLAD